MAFEQKDMEGVLFKNDKREKDTHPQATGYGTLDGRKVWISAWTNEGQKGKYQKLSFKWADEGAEEIRGRRDHEPLEDDGDLPF